MDDATLDKVLAIFGRDLFAISQKLSAIEYAVTMTVAKNIDSGDGVLKNVLGHYLDMMADGKTK